MKEEVFFLTKPGESGTVISVISLDFLTNETYLLNNFVNDIDLSHDGLFAVYTHIVYLDLFKPMWLWQINLGDYLERKVYGWDENYFDVMISGPSYSLDDEKIYFTVTWFSSGITGLAKVDIDGKNFQIMETDISLTEGPEPSPDGSLILVTCSGIDQITGDPGFHLCLLDNKGKFIRFISDIGDGHGSYNFTPDGKKIVYNEIEIGGVFGIINRPKHRFYIYDLETGERTVLLNWEVGVKGFSDDGQEIILEGRLNKKSPWGIYIINIDGTNLRHLTYFDEFLEEWYVDVEEY